MLAQVLDDTPCLFINDRFLSAFKNHPIRFIRLFDFLVFIGIFIGAKVHGAASIFRSFQYCGNGVPSPSIGITIIAIRLMISQTSFGKVIRWPLNFSFCKAAGDFIRAFSVHTHLKDFADNGSGFFVYNPLVWILRVFFVPITSAVACMRAS